MRATIIHGPGDIRVEDRDYPTLQQPTDAVVKVTASCVCGSDLWPYRGVRPTNEPRAIGHEFIGLVESIGDAVTDLAVGDLVIAPFVVSCGKCPQCLNGVTVACDHLAGWGGKDDAGLAIDGGQGQAVRVPLADATLVKVPGITEPDDALRASLLTLSDVMATGHHAALAAQVGPGRTVVVVGDGAVGLCGVLAAKRLGAVVSATDVRPDTKEQVESLGGKFVAPDSDESGAGEGGYAKEMSDEYKAKQAEMIAEALKKTDIAITTALIPGRAAPVLITEEHVNSMKPGSVIVDLAVEQGGNCPLSRPGEVVDHNGVKIVGHYNWPSRVAADSSTLYAKNLLNFLSPHLDKETGTLNLDWEDETVTGTALTRDGEIVHPLLKSEGA